MSIYVGIKSIIHDVTNLYLRMIQIKLKLSSIRAIKAEMHHLIEIMLLHEVHTILQ